MLVALLALPLAGEGVQGVQARWSQAVDAFNAGDYSRAATAFAEIIRLSPKYAGGYYMLGRSQSALGQGSQALGNLRKAVELDGQNPSYRIALAEVLCKAGQFQEAYSALQPLKGVDARYRTSYALVFAQAATRSGHAAEAVRVVGAQLQTDTADPRLFQALGLASSASGDDRQAFSAFKRAYELAPASQASGRLAVESGITAALRCADEGEKVATYRAAAEVAERLVATADSFDNLRLAGEAWLGGQDYAKALRWFAKAQAQRPDDPLLRLYKGQSYSALGKLDLAVGELQAALVPSLSGALRSRVYDALGGAYEKRGEYDRSIDAYQQAGDSPRAARARAAKERDAQRHQLEAQLDDLEKKLAEAEKLRLIEEVDALKARIGELTRAMAELRQEPDHR